MKNLFEAGRVLLLDLASTVLFLALYIATDNLFLAVGLGHRQQDRPVPGPVRRDDDDRAPPGHRGNGIYLN